MTGNRNNIKRSQVYTRTKRSKIYCFICPGAWSILLFPLDRKNPNAVYVINYLSSRRGCWCRSSFPLDTRWAGGYPPETRICTSPPPGPCRTPEPPGPQTSGGWSFAPAGQTPDDSYPRDRGHYRESAWKSRFVTHSPAHGCWYFVNTGEISLRPCHISLNGWLGSYQSHVLVNVISLPKNKK